MVETTANTGISVRLNKQREKWLDTWKSWQLKRRGPVWEVILNPGSISPKLPPSVPVPPSFSIDCDSLLSTGPPVLEGGGIFLYLRSSLAQGLLQSGAKDAFPRLLVMQNSISPWGRVGLTLRKSGKLGRTWNKWRELKGARKSPVKLSFPGLFHRWIISSQLLKDYILFFLIVESSMQGKYGLN